MKKDDRRRHYHPDSVWVTKEGSEPGTLKHEFDRRDVLLMDLRAALHDILDEQRETNRILRMAFGVDKKEDET